MIMPKKSKLSKENSTYLNIYVHKDLPETFRKLYGEWKAQSQREGKKTSELTQFYFLLYILELVIVELHQKGIKVSHIQTELKQLIEEN